MTMPAPFHSLPVSEIQTLLELKSAEGGLNPHEVASRQNKFGRNTLPKAAKEGAFRVFLRQFHNPLVYVLLGSAALAGFMGQWTDAGVVLSVVVINSIIGFIQEYRAGQAMEALAAMVPQKALTLRDGRRQEIFAEELTRGDLVFLQSGDKVPADLRLLEVKNLQIEEAALTGESVPVAKNLSLTPSDASLGDRTNMAYSGTLVTYGTASGLVVAIGAETELGKISSLLKQTESLETPLTRSLARVGGVLTLGISVVAILLIGIGWARGYALTDAILAAVTLAVAAIPEGLPAIVTITLAIGVRRMAARKAVVRRLPAVETLGSTNVICSDKTGTLTKNEMTVQAVSTLSHEMRITGIGYSPKGESLIEGVRTPPSSDAIEVLKAGVLCSEATLVNKNDLWSVHGDPTEGALVVAFEKLAGDSETLRRSMPRLDVFPFESENQFMATLHQQQSSAQSLLILKGAPEVILNRCHFADPNESKRINERVAALAQEGMRVLAFATRSLSKKTIEHSDFSDCRFLGLQAMIDPARPEAIEAIRQCHAAGITVKMITGDHKDTAHAIARQLGIDNGVPPVTGEELARVSDQDLPAVASRTNVFARVAPEHKLRLVRALQSQNLVVAMTGDGVNDAPALKQANVGIAMGITGTPVSKEAAELILTDDNFATIRTAVEEGRRVYDNLVKSLAFVLPTNLGEALIILVAVLFFPIVEGSALMPILPVQILWINLVATIALALPLSFEAKEPDVMQRRPRPRNESLMSRFVIYRTVIVAIVMAIGSIGLFWHEYHSMLALGANTTQSLREAQTMAVTTVIFFQIFYLLSCRSLKGSMFSIGIFSNPTVFIGIGSLLILQGAFVHWPLLQNLFHSASLSPQSWMKAVLAGTVVIPVVALEKLWRQYCEKKSLLQK